MGDYLKDTENLTMGNYTTFEQLDCYKKCRDLRIWIHEFLKMQNIKDRDLIQNIKRAGRSTTRNIAEGFGRFHFKENRQYCRIALGSLHEILDDLNIIEDENICKKKDLVKGRILAYQALKSTQGCIKYLSHKI